MVNLHIFCQISGCREVEVYAEDIKMIGCSVNSVGAQAIVTEEGTGVQKNE